MWATNCSNLPLVSFLLSHGADIEAKSVKGATCEDFILSSTPGVGVSRLPTTAMSDTMQVASTSLRVPLSPHSSDRQLIADLVFEHQQTVSTERAAKSSTGQRQHLRSLSSSSSQDSAPDSVVASSLAPAASILSSSSARSGHSRNSSITLRRLMGRTERTQIAEAELRARELAEGRRRALLDVAVMMQVDYSDLIGEAPPSTESPDERSSTKRRMRRRGGADRGKAVHSGLSSGCGAVEVGGDSLSNEFDFDVVRPDQMLVLGQHQVAPLLHPLITEAKPLRAPWTARSKPANVLYMCIRYACSLPDEALLEDLVFGAVDCIEAKLYAHPTEMTHLAYWLSNCMLLLHYMMRDKTLQGCEDMHEYTPLVADLINEIYVFVVRDMERRIDKVMDAAILDHNPIPGFDDVRFEGEWSFIKTLTGSVKRASQTGHASPTPKGQLSQLFAADSASSSPDGKKRDSVRLPATPTSTLAELREPSHDASAADLLAKPMPRTITQLLTSTLHILQLYEVNPSVIVQVLSQVFFWVGCELFNRVISQRKFLCKSKAMQIRLNVSALEDWVKTNALPLSIVSQHLCRLNQLVSWLLCQSSLTEFDGLIATMQGLKSLNPNQLKRVVKDYRHEVGESKIHPDCMAYLDQLQADWEKRQQQEADEGPVSGHARSGTATQSHPNGRSENGKQEQEQEAEEGPDSVGFRGRDDDEDDDDGYPARPGRDDTADTMDSGKTAMGPGVAREQRYKDSVTAKATQRLIDVLFEAGQSMTSYVPPPSTTPQSPFSVLLNSRDMLPFALPSHAEALIVSPGDAFGFGRGHFMGTGTPSLKSFRNESLLGARGPGAVAGSAPGSPAMTASASSETSSRASQASGSQTSHLYPQGKGLAAGAYWQPVPLLPEETLEEIQAVMRTAEQEARFGASRRPSIETRLSETAITSPVLSPSPLLDVPSPHTPSPSTDMPKQRGAI